MTSSILFSDFDGTLYIGGAVSEENRAAIRRWQSLGGLFCLATGRQADDVQRHLDAQGVRCDVLMCLNGAEGYDRQGRLLFSHTLDGAMLPELFRLVTPGCGWANVSHGHRLERIALGEEDRLSSFSRFSQISSMYEDMAEAERAKARVLNRFDGLVCAQVNGHCLDVDAVGVDKASGITSMLEALGLDENRAFCVGDNFNDLCMLTAYHGFAMDNAPDEVKRIVGRTVPSVAALLHLLLKNGMN